MRYLLWLCLLIFSTFFRMLSCQCRQSKDFLSINNVIYQTYFFIIQLFNLITQPTKIQYLVLNCNQHNHTRNKTNDIISNKIYENGNMKSSSQRDAMITTPVVSKQNISKHMADILPDDVPNLITVKCLYIFCLDTSLSSWPWRLSETGTL